MTEERGPLRRNRFFRTAAATLCAGAFALGGVATVSAQDATPEATPSQPPILETVIENAEGEVVGYAHFTKFDGAVGINVTVDGLEPGEHGIHIHETGTCDPSGDEPFSSAGGHFNPTGASHGAGPAQEGTPVATPESAQAHAGDLGNILVDENGTGTTSIVTPRVSVEPDAEHTLDDEDGSAIVVHANPDDLMTDPSGESGPRIACGVIFPPEGGTPAATPSS